MPYLEKIRDFKKAIFLRRLNRFIVECSLNGKIIKAHLPNSGRLMELLIEGRTLYIHRDNRPERTTQYTTWAVEKEGLPVFLHTFETNNVASYLIENSLLDFFAGYRVSKREYTAGMSRFDFLLENGAEKLILEIKSCTHFSENIAMFPDAITSRGKRHLLDLARSNYKGAVVFFVHSGNCDYFLPNYHDDLEFSKELYKLKDKIIIKAYGLTWNKDLSFGEKIKELTIPWETLKKEAQDRGSYILILRLNKPKTISVGSLGLFRFKKGYYIYIGSAMKNLTSRIRRHQRRNKKSFWHIDFLREKADFFGALPIRSRDNLECAIAQDIKAITDWKVDKFGSSDCNCSSHLYGMRENPFEDVAFIKLLTDYRMNRLSKH